MELRNKKVLITGGSVGIGKALVQELVQRGVQNIAVMGRRLEPIEVLKAEFPTRNFLAIQGNVGNPKDLDKAIATISKTWGELDILINNAGVVSAGLLAEVSEEDVINQINY